ITSSTSFSRKRAGRSTRRVIGNSRSRECRTTRARASWITCFGAMTVSRSRWSKPNAPGGIRASASSKPSSTPIAWRTTSASGGGKTRTVIALADLLMRCNWAKRVLFLADRVALVNQAVNAFKRHLPDAAPVNLVTEKDAEGRVFVATYPTMMGLIDETREGQRRFGPGHFDLVVIDEAT